MTVQAVRSHAYEGPAGVFFTPDELLQIWADLSRIPSTDNKSIRDKVTAYLQSKEINGNP